MTEATPARAILHVGTMKTGTSSIQSALVGNPDVLARHGLMYLGWPMRRARDIERRLSDLPPGTGPIISDEGLWHRAGTRRSDTRRIAQVLERFQVTVIVYLRRPDEFVEAWFSQGLKRGTGPARIDEFMDHHLVNQPVPSEDTGEPTAAGRFQRINLRVLHVLDVLSDAFPAATFVVRPYEKRQLIGGDVVLDFLDAAGLGDVAPEASFNHGGAQNASPDASDILMASLLRHGFAVPGEILSTFLDLPHRQSERRILTYEEATEINAAMRPVFRHVQATWGGGAADDFFLDWDQDPTTYRVSELRAIYDRVLAGPREAPPDGRRRLRRRWRLGSDA